MFESKYSKILTAILVIVIIAIVILLGFLGYDYYQKYFTSKQASDFVENYQGDVTTGNETTNSSDVSGNVSLDGLEDTPTSNTGSSSNGTKRKYKGFTVVGTMKIPKINFEYPILEEVSTKSIETGVAVLYPNADNINQPGNTVIIGHNYRNGLFFSNLKKLSNGDKVYITDYRGTSITYTIYNKFETSESDTSFYQRDTNGKAEITLSTCTDASNDQRTIIFAKQGD